MELENTSTSSKFRMPPDTGVGTSQQFSGRRRTRRWPVRYTQGRGLASSMLLRWTSISPARSGGAEGVTRVYLPLETAGFPFFRVAVGVEKGNRPPAPDRRTNCAL